MTSRRLALIQPEPGQSRYAALATALRHRIVAGEWPPGTPLPAETSLAAEHSVALGTLRRALELLEPGGYLISCSCSYHMGREPFREMLATAARQAKREVRLVTARSQAPDHPVLLNFPESEYLKCFVLQVV